MNMLFSFYFCLLGAVMNNSDPDIYSLFYHWNKMSLTALNNNIKLADNPAEKDLYKDRLSAKSEMWGVKPGSINSQSLRWLFLEQISTDFKWKDKDWSVIEVVKNGERTSLRNYLICYNEKQTTIIVYDFYKGKWTKIREDIEHFKMRELIDPKEKVPIYEGWSLGDVVVTNFKSALPLKSEYFVETTLAKNCIISKIIAH